MLFRRAAALAVGLLALLLCTPVNAAELGFRDLLRNPGTPLAGASDADVIIVMYADYNCGYCKRMEPVLAAALKTDSRLAVVHKEWPIFGGVSAYAARVALAANYQGRYDAVHSAFMLSPTRLSDKDIVDAVAKKAGVDWTQLLNDMKVHSRDIDVILARNAREASVLALEGTPGLVINGYLLRGALSGDQLKQVLRKIRAEEMSPST